MRKPEDTHALIALDDPRPCGVRGGVHLGLSARHRGPALARAGHPLRVAVACLAIVPVYLIYHVVTPVPLFVAFKQIVFDTVRVVLMGIVVAWLNRS